ncbi:Choline-sulfatase [Stieleria maiorica]|uniref:Choline-sulfatase n=1 Tax=Stieleria maiorica TaxID=2795974 RepID=A0A5B9MFT0_9BACT|nr:sulfatase [Stieleria maiorica]QEG00102.1 Choline-sulfatase [Stieleria maiorica]
MLSHSKQFAIAALVALLWLPTALSDAATARPNLVFVIADDCTFRDIGCYGGQAHTPNIDALAEQGMKFTRCFQAAPMCSPTRHNIYTGLYPVKSGAYPNHTFAKAGTQSIVHYLKPLGYRVALSGKTHIDPKEVFPFEYSGVKNNPDMSAIDQLLSECAESSTPFCLFACSNEPHSPWNKGDASRYPPEQVKLPPYLADTPVMRENFSRYLAEITYYDDQVGQILELIDKHEMADNTLVVVVSEQGNSFPFAKWTCYGNGLQSAMIVRWPGRVQPGAVSDAMVEYVDVTPTFVEAAGGEPAEVLDGKSFVPVLTGQTDTHKSVTYGIMTTRGIINGSDAYAIRSVRDDRYRLIWNLNHETKFTNACTKADYFQSMVQAGRGGDAEAAKLVRKYQYRPEFELFDCDVDPLEMNNIVDDPQHIEVVTRLKGQLRQWMQSQGDEGVETELDALAHQGRYKGKSRAEAMEAFRRRDSGAKPKSQKRPGGKKENVK